MRTYLISYDLAKPHRNQHVLAQVIMGLGDKWARPLANTWYVASDRDEIELEARAQRPARRRGRPPDPGGEARGGSDQHVASAGSASAAPGLDIEADSNIIAFPTPPGRRADRTGTAVRRGWLRAVAV